MELAPSIDRLIDMAEAVMAGEEGFDPAVGKSRFRLAAAEFVTALIGERLVQTFHREAPRASFALDYLSGGTTLDVLRRGEIDLFLGQFLTLPRSLP